MKIPIKKYLAQEQHHGSGYVDGAGDDYGRGSGSGSNHSYCIGSGTDTGVGGGSGSDEYNGFGFGFGHASGIKLLTVRTNDIN